MFFSCALAIISISSANDMPVSSRLARKTPSIRPTVGKFWTPEKPSAFSWSRKRSMSRNGSVPLTPASTGVLAIAIGHESGERAASGHAIAAGIVDHDEVDATGLFAFGRETGAGTAA